MPSVDNIHIVKQQYTLFNMLSDVFDKENIWTSIDFLPYLNTFAADPKENAEMINLLEMIIVKAFEPQVIGRMKKFRFAERKLYEKLKNEQKFFEDKIIIPTNGLSIDEHGLRDGLDPYSPEFRFTNSLLDIAKTLDPEFLDKIVLMFMQPWTFVPLIKRDNEGNIKLEDILAEDLKKYTFENLYAHNDFKRLSLYELKEDEVLYNEYKEIIEKVGAVAIGSLTKPADNSIPTFRYRERLLDVKPIKKSVTKSPADFKKDVYRPKLTTVDEFVKHHARLVKLGKMVMAVKWKKYLEILEPSIKNMINNYDLEGLPLYMEKTSASSDIIKQAIKFSGLNIPIQYIGGFEGILSGKQEAHGIHSGIAINKLTGFLQTAESIWTGNHAKKYTRIKVPKANIIRYKQSKEYPWVLLEENIKGRHPNQTDLVPKFITKRGLEIVNKYMVRTTSGNIRVEPRLVELMFFEGTIKANITSEDKRVIPWQEYIAGKTPIFDLKSENFFGRKATFLSEQSEKLDLSADFRGSELSAHVNCARQRVIARGMRLDTYDILKPIVQKGREGEFHRFLDHILREPIAAHRGTKLHELTYQPFDGLVHYETLTLIPGVDEPVPSDHYCEILFEDTLHNPITDKDFTISFHPDTLFFLKDDNNVYDIVIIDKKTNRKISTMETYYKKQVTFYGMMVEKFMKEQGYKTGNIIVMLDKNSFNDQFLNFEEDQPKFLNINSYRKQEYEGISIIEPHEWYRREVMHEVYKTVEFKERIMNGDLQLSLDIKKEMEKKTGKYCAKDCFFEDNQVCAYSLENEIDLMAVLEGQRVD
ncbi:MAG: hypothetical protein ABH828_00865 [archaeon]